MTRFPDFIRRPYYTYKNNRYSSEITGTIMVQCIPVLRSLLRDINTSLASKKLSSTLTHSRSSFHTNRSRKRATSGAESAGRSSIDKVDLIHDSKLSIETAENGQLPQSLLSPRFAVNFTTQASPQSDSWGLSPRESRFRKSRDRDTWSSLGNDLERDGPLSGLSPPPPVPPKT